MMKINLFRSLKRIRHKIFYNITHVVRNRHQYICKVQYRHQIFNKHEKYLVQCIQEIMINIQMLVIITDENKLIRSLKRIRHKIFYHITHVDRNRHQYICKVQYRHQIFNKHEKYLLQCIQEIMINIQMLVIITLYLR